MYEDGSVTSAQRRARRENKRNYGHRVVQEAPDGTGANEMENTVQVWNEVITATTAQYVDSLIAVGHIPADCRADAIIEVDRVVDTFLQGDKEEK